MKSDEFKRTGLAKLIIEKWEQKLDIKSKNGSEAQTVMINFDTSDVKISEEIQLSTLPDFISAVGGNLGLFVGFSCLPLLLWLADVFQRFEIFP